MASINEDYIKDHDSDAERRFFPSTVEFETRAEGSADNVIVGYAAPFNSSSDDLGGFVEDIDERAFDEVLDQDTYGLFNHNINQILGRNKVNMKLSVDKKGLKYRIELPDTATANEVRTLIKAGIIDKSSFAFKIAEQRWQYATEPGQPHKRTIMKVKRLFDVSPVAGPAYRDTSVAVRSMKQEEPQKQDQDTMSDEWYLTLTELRRFETI